MSWQPTTRITHTFVPAGKPRHVLAALLAIMVAPAVIAAIMLLVAR